MPLIFAIFAFMAAGWRLAAVTISDTIFLILFTVFLIAIASYTYLKSEV